MYLFIYKTVHENGRYYIGRHSTKNLNDGYLGSGRWVEGIIEKSKLHRKILAEAATESELKLLEEYYINIHFDDPLCMNMKKSSVGWTQDDISGKNHPRYSGSVHHFRHKDGREEICTCYELRQKYTEIPANHLYAVARGDQLSVKGWSLMTPKKIPKETPKKVYHFIHKSGKEEICTPYELRIKYPTIKPSGLSKMMNGNRKTTSGWRIVNLELDS